MTIVDDEALAMREALERALAALRAKYGTDAAAAAAMDMTRQRVQSWRVAGRVSHKCVSIVAEHSGIPEHELRPDIVRAPKRRTGGASLSA